MDEDDSDLWALLMNNAIVQFLISAFQSYLATMSELAENTVKGGFVPIFRQKDVTIIVAGILGFLGLLITFNVISSILRFVYWIVFGSSCSLNHMVDGANASNNNANSTGSERGYVAQSGYVERNPQSRRWMKQAIYDLESARNDFEADCPAPEWVCFKCQQALEKALKAYLIYKDPSHVSSASSKTHDLCDLAALTNNNDLVSATRRLQGILGLSQRMRYPDFLPFPKVPRDVYSLEGAIVAHELTETAIEQIERLMESPHGRCGL